MTNTFSRRFMLGLAASTALTVSGVTSAFAEGWSPQKPVEMVIMAGQGGGADRLARLFQSIIQKEGLSSMPILPVNKGGGSGAEALRYLKDKSGDAHVIMATLNSYYTTPLRTDIGVDIAEFTPLARMAEDTFILWVNADSGITNLDEYVAAVKAAGKDWKMGGTGTGQEDSLVTAMLEREFGLEMTYVPFDGGGDVAKNLIGNHINSTVNNPSEQMGFYKAGKSIPLVAFTPERIAAFPDVPTARELGHDIVYAMQRSFVAPPGMPEEAVAYYTEMFRKLSELPEWQEYTADEALDPSFLSGAELQDYFLTEREKHNAILKDMGELPAS
ncbi:tripartite tricarboxylate transporter substrate binding protein [Thalassococcus sp. CAU 1522]|uniref:Tripartite tricarboxylate transporter substrate binding protein n=1 Tax=Thalassococcus arenae TaxID=2851652 RepID=A0ABS6N4Y1_9RHOB|nr:tripartite tricarboxylate transporter substrate binding protein [Thalassococcus arenae]MBV2358605.1 tripartite tricarboxylate transporter substrate binding protein [Thalassococcus arenae]